MKNFYTFLGLLCSIILLGQVKSQDYIPSIQPFPLEACTNINAAFHSEEENKNFFFRNENYLRLSNNKVDKGYPSKVQNGWKDLPEYWHSQIDAALKIESTNTTIFFNGREYFSIQNGYPISPLPKKLPGKFKNLPRYFHSNIDAAIYADNHHRMYLFKGNQYVRIKNNRVEQGYPKMLPGEFQNLPKEFCSNVNAALYQNGHTYFYKNGRSTNNASMVRHPQD